MDERPAKDDTSKKQATSKLSASSTSSLRPPPPPITAPVGTGGHPRSLQDTNHDLQPDPLPHTAASIVTKANDSNQDTLDDDEPAHAEDLADVQLQPPPHDGRLAWTTGHATHPAFRPDPLPHTADNTVTTDDNSHDGKADSDNHAATTLTTTDQLQPSLQQPSRRSTPRTAIGTFLAHTGVTDGTTTALPTRHTRADNNKPASTLPALPADDQASLATGTITAAAAAPAGVSKSSNLPSSTNDNLVGGDDTVFHDVYSPPDDADVADDGNQQTTLEPGPHCPQTDSQPELCAPTTSLRRNCCSMTIYITWTPCLQNCHAQRL
eukprot:COSAG01_NODE_10227_length_2216_cov_4.551252_2_plen_323_part_00